MRLNHRSIALSLAIGLSACSLGQDPAAMGTQRTAQEAAAPLGQVVTEIDPRIWCIHQTRNGDYWFGSNGNGVYRYDGQKVTHYTRVDGMGGDQVRDIEEDAEGNVFVSTYSGVFKFDGAKFTALEIVDGLPAESAWALKPDDVWIIFNPGNGGPCRYDGVNLYQLNAPINHAEDALPRKYTDPDFSLSGIYSIYKDRRGHLWFGTANGALCRFDGQTLSWMYEERLTTTPDDGAFGIRSIFEDRAGDFWICNTRNRFDISPKAKLEGGRSLLKYKKSKGLPDAQSDTAKNFTYYPSMIEDDKGVLWMACGSDGALRYDGETVTHYDVGDRAYALTIYYDQGGKLWIGTVEQGIYTFEGSSFEPFKPPTPDK
jgi:ligand-binding sensor domain-containing protein